MGRIFVLFVLMLGIIGCGGGGSVSGNYSIDIPSQVSDYKITDTSLSDNEKSNLTIKGISEDEDGNKITVGALSDVIATKKVTYTNFDGSNADEERIVFRSFAFGKWIGQLNHETTLLSRVFMGTDFPKLSSNEQESLVSQVVNSEFYNDGLMKQRLYIENPILFEKIYFDAVALLQQIVLNHNTSLKRNKRQRNNNKTLRYTKDLDNIGGSLKLTYDSNINAFVFHNYFSLYFGLKTYDKNDNTYNLINTFSDNLIEPVSGGVLGGLIAEFSDWINLSRYTGTPADDKKFGMDFDSSLFMNEKNAYPNIHKTYEIYKYQGFELSTFYNVTHAVEILLGGFVKKKWKDKLKKNLKFLDKANDEILKKADTILSSIEAFGVVNSYMQSMDANSISYSFEDTINKIRTYLDMIKSINPINSSRYDTYLNESDTSRNKDLKFAPMVLTNKSMPINKTLKQKIKEKKKKNVKIRIIGYMISQYLKSYELLPNKNSKYTQFKKDYSFISANDYAYLAAMLAFDSKDTITLLKKAYSQKIDSTKYLEDYASMLSEINKETSIVEWGKDTINKNLKELKEIANAADLIRNASRGIANADLLSLGSLKVMISLLKNTVFKGFDTNHLATLLAKKIAGSYVNLALAINEGGSFAYGSFLLPNKMYFDVKTDKNGDIDLILPSYAPLGLLSDEYDEVNNLGGLKGIKVFQGNYGALAIAGSYYLPVYKFYFMAGNPESVFQKEFYNDTFMHIKYNIRRSTNDTKGYFNDDLENVNNTFEADISPLTMQNLWISGDYGYYINIWDAYRIEKNLSTGNVTIYNKTRGIYKEWIEMKSYYPDAGDRNSPVMSNTRYVYKVADESQIKDNLEIEEVNNNLWIQNKGNFTICLSSSNNTNDICIGSNKGITMKYDDLVDYSASSRDTKLHFFDSIFETFLKEEHYKNYSDFYEKNDGYFNINMSDMTYTLDLFYFGPNKIDSDKDGISDDLENSMYHTNPHLIDTDGDGIDDGWEIQHALNPLDKNDAKIVTSTILGNYTNLDLYLQSKGVPFVISKKYNTISGIVSTPSGNPLSNINIKFEYIQNGKNQEVLARSDNKGTYLISIDKEDFDNFKDDTKLVISAYADGYVPQIKEITKTDETNINVDFQLEPIKENEIVLEIEPHLHHLGDGHYTGSANSDFQRAGAEGKEFVKTFDIDANKFNNYKRAVITFEAKGVQNYSNKLYINNHAYSLQSSPYDGSYATQKISINKSEYSIGTNEIKITSGQNSYGDFDDFEFINIKITFLDPIDQNIKPIVTDLELSTIDNKSKLQIITRYDANNGSKVSDIDWTLISPSGKVLNYAFRLNNIEYNGYARFQTNPFSKEAFFSESGLYTITTYVANEDGTSSDISRDTIYIDIKL